jgi:subtilisin family serine protease
MRSRPVLVGLAMAMLTSVWLAAAAQAAPPTGDYIVVLNDGAKPAAVAKRHGRTFDVKVHAVWRHALKGYAGRIRGTELAALRRDRSVAYVEKDGTVRVAKARGKGKPGSGASSYSFASWGLDRIDQRSLPLDSAYDASGDGAGVRVYVIDTGIRLSHSQLSGRVSSGADFIDGGSADDCNGHGTHVAGTIAGSTYGVAPKADVVAVRVLDCSGSGSWSGVISGIDWVAKNASGPAVANLSLGGGASSAVDEAIDDLAASGVTVVVAAGNSAQNACNFSPARAAGAIAVAATTKTDDWASYSNFGSCVELFAPGSAITSAWSSGDSATNTISGTSMASPHVAGAAALILQDHPTWGAGQVRDEILTTSTKNDVKGINKPRFSGTPNRLLWVD